LLLINKVLCLKKYQRNFRPIDSHKARRKERGWKKKKKKPRRSTRERRTDAKNNNKTYFNDYSYRKTHEKHDRPVNSAGKMRRSTAPEEMPKFVQRSELPDTYGTTL
jgi:hypothetical protein